MHLNDSFITSLSLKKNKAKQRSYRLTNVNFIQTKPTEIISLFNQVLIFFAKIDFCFLFDSSFNDLILLTRKQLIKALFIDANDVFLYQLHGIVFSLYFSPFDKKNPFISNNEIRNIVIIS